MADDDHSNLTKYNQYLKESTKIITNPEEK
jgi:hypothetical protein